MDDQAKSLRKELAILEDEFSRKVEALEKRIDRLEGKEIWSESGKFSEQPSTADIKETQKQNQLVNETTISLKTDLTNTNPVSDQALNQALKPQPSQSSAQAKIKETPSISDWEINALSEGAGKQSLFALLAPILGPLASLISFFLKLYRHYQEQGKAPVFFMTITGVVALVLGFAYLLQYSFNEYFGPTGKVFFGFVVAIAVTAGGVRLSKTSKDMSEYGSSIIALGVILNFLCAYFAGPYYDLLPAVGGFLLLASVTAAAFILALLFETRVVAIVTLVGGAAMPIIMGHEDQSPMLYLSYLLVLSVAMLNLSQRIQWHQLAYVCMGLCAGMIEFSIANRTQIYTESYGLIAIIHGFFYAFGHYALKGLNYSTVMNKPRLMIVSSNIIFYLFISHQLILSSELMGVLLLINVVPWVGLFLFPIKVFHYSPGSDENRAVQAIALLHAGLLAGVGILILSSPELMGVIWCIEALMLIYLGCKFQFIAVRIEGYIALFVSLVAMSAQVIFWLSDAVVPEPILLALNMDMGWANLIAITILVYGAVTLFKREQGSLTEKESILVIISQNLFSVCLSLSFLLTIGIFSAQGMWLFAIVPMFYLIWRSKTEDLILTELFGLAHFLLLIVPLAVSAGVVGNFHFSEQSIFAQIARVEAFLGLWLLAEFYKRFYPESSNFEFSENLRKLFYCLVPVLFLPKILRQYSDYFPLALWLSSTIALFLYSRLKFTILKLELRILVLCASVIAIVSCGFAKFDNWQGNAVGALFAGLVFFLVIGWLGQALRRVPSGSLQKLLLNEALKPLFTVAIYYFGLAIFIVLYQFTASSELSLLMTIIYFTALSVYQPVLAPMRSNLRTVHTVIFSLFSVVTASHLIAVLSHRFGGMHELWLALINGIAVFCSFLLVYRYTPQNRAVWQKMGGRILNVWVFNLITIAAYVSLLAQLFDDMLGPVISFSLVVHATAILFQTIEPKMKKLIWLSVVLYGSAAIKVLLWDMSDFSLIQKIVVFMLIGLCMLGAAFKFQKVVAQRSESAH